MNEDVFGRNLNNQLNNQFNQFNGNHLNGNQLNGLNARNLIASNDQNAQKLLPDLINGQPATQQINSQLNDCQAPERRLNANFHSNGNGNLSNLNGNAISHKPSDSRALPEPDFERIDFIAEHTHRLPSNGSMSGSISGSVSGASSTTSNKANLTSSSALDMPAPKLPFKSQPTTNYCNVAQIVETSKCNQISIDLSAAPTLPPKLPPKKASALQAISRKIDFNQLSDLKFDSNLNQKLSQHLNQQFDQHDQMHRPNQLNPPMNQQLTSQPDIRSFNQFNQFNQLSHLNSQLNGQNLHAPIQSSQHGQSAKNALLVCPNSILASEQNKPSRQTRSTENIKFRSNSLSSTGTNQMAGHLGSEFANHEQRKHHSDNEVIKDFLQINKNINELAMNRNVNSMTMMNGMANGSTVRVNGVPANNGILTHPISSNSFCGSAPEPTDQQIVFRRKNQATSISEHTSSIVQLNELQLNQYLDDRNAATNDRRNDQTNSQGNDELSGSRPSSQYDNLSLSELGEQPSFSPPSASSHLAQAHSCNAMLTGQNNLNQNSLNHNSLNQNSLNLSWQSNNFSSTLSSSSSSNCPMDGHLEPPHDRLEHSNGSSNRSSDRSMRYPSRASNQTDNPADHQTDNQSQSSYENEEDLPPPLPKKNKNISVYCQLFSSYTAPKDKCYRYSVHTVQEIYRSQATYQQVELSFNQQKEFHNLNNQLMSSGFQQNQHANRHRLTASSITTSSDDSMFSIDSFNSDSSKETNLLPLPPKRSVNRLAIPEKPEAYRYKHQLPAKFQHHSYQSNDPNEIKTAKLKHFDSLDFACRPDSPLSLQKSER